MAKIVFSPPLIHSPALLFFATVVELGNKLLRVQRWNVMS